MYRSDHTIPDQPIASWFLCGGDYWCALLGPVGGLLFGPLWALFWSVYLDLIGKSEVGKVKSYVDKEYAKQRARAYTMKTQ